MIKNLNRCLSFLLALQMWAVPSFAGAASPSLKIISARAIPFSSWKSPGGIHPFLRKVAPAYGDSFLGRPVDVRWDGNEHVLIAACRDGTLRASVSEDEGHAQLERAYAPLPGMGSLGLQYQLGASPEFLVAAAPGHLMSWIPRALPDPKPVSIEMDFNTIIDLDVYEDRLLVLGLQKLEKGKLAADGAIAWTAKLGKKLTHIQPVQFSISGPGAHDTAACSEMQMGKVRFLPGGSFVVVPGGEPGIFVHDASGKLVKTWQAETVGFDAGCPITEDEMYKYSADIHARYRWLNQHRVLDEVLPLPGGIGFLIRTYSKGMTRWDLKVLSPDGRVTRYDVPVTSPSEYARLAADVRGNRIALLLNLDTFETPPAGSQHLIIAELPGAPGTASPAAKPAPTKKTPAQKPAKP
jgi:hypothetical protein